MVKRLAFKAILVVFIMFGLGNYALYLATGRVPDLSWSMPTALKLPDWKSWVAKISPENLAPVNDKTTEAQIIYKWKGKDGAWNLSTEVPPEGVSFEKIVADANLNVIPAVKALIVEAPDQAEEQGKMSAEAEANPYSVQGVKDLLQKSKDMQKLLDDRSQQQKEALEKL